MNRNRLVVLGAAVLFVGCLAYAVLSLTGALQLLAPTYTNADFGIGRGDVSMAQIASSSLISIGVHQ